MKLPQSYDHQVSVRQASISDAASISTMYINLLKSYGHAASYNAVSRFLVYILAQPWTLFFVASDDASNRLIGFAGCTMTYSAVSQAGAISLNDMYVEIDARRHGVATALCGAIETHARRNDLAKIFLQTDPEAKNVIAMYEKAGFHAAPFLAMTMVVLDAKSRK